MRKLSEFLRLQAAGFSNRQIAASLSISPSTVSDYRRRTRLADLRWPLPPDGDAAALEARLFPPTPPSAVTRPLPDWAEIAVELKRKGVTLALLWQEHRERQPDGLGYSAFCQRYRDWAKNRCCSLRQDYRAGEKMLTDYAGPTVAIADPSGGLPREAQIFIAVLGASNYTFAEATWTQRLPDWIASHVRAFAYFGGVPEMEIVDNLKSGVSRACRYDPDLNPTFAAMAAHYGIAVIPARPCKPRDKAKAESAVQVAERWILAPLRHRVFFSLEELNAALAERLEALNARPFQKIEGSRRSLFETVDQPALKPLPATPYEYAEWERPQVNVDYHVEVRKHYYSVPFALIGQRMEARLTEHVVELFHQGQRVASHRRCTLKGRHTTVDEHMPPAHQKYLEWTPQRLLSWAEKTGPVTRRFIEALMAARTHPQQGFRAALGILRLGDRDGAARLEAACNRALTLRSFSYRSVDSILRHHLDQQPLTETPPNDTPPLAHDNLRGRDYYQ